MQKEADNSALTVRIIDAYERATLKPWYDLLKEYKQGLLIDAEVEEEIKLYEDSLAEARDSSSALDTAAAPKSNEPEPVAIMPPSNANLSEGQETKL